MSKLLETLRAHVSANPRGHEPGGSYRTGTARLTLDKARQLFGPPHAHGDGDKVTCEWFFNTPRGNATLRDYWWNGSGSLSIASNGGKAALWLAAYLRREYDVRAYRGMPERFTA